jgi:hypothetical protein
VAIGFPTASFRASAHLLRDLGALPVSDWMAGLRRMLLGYGAGRDDPWQGIEPFEEIGGLQAGVAGNLYRFVDRLEELWHELGPLQRLPAGSIGCSPSSNASSLNCLTTICCW